VTPAPAWRPIVVQATAMWLATRVALALLTYVTVIFNGFGNTRIAPGFVTGQWDLGTLVGSWQRWDAGWFAQIAQQGYTTPETAAFFPLYPLLIHLGIAVTGPSYLILVALIISNLAALVGFIGVALLAAREEDPHPTLPRERGRESVVPFALRVLAAYPLAFFLAAPYSDALLLAAAAFVLLLARQGRWGWTALVAFIAALTRSTAVILFLPIVWEYGRQHAWWDRDRWRALGPRRLLAWRAWPQAIMVLGALPLGLACYAAYLGYRFGRPLLFLQAHAHWDRQATPVWLSLRHAFGDLVKVSFGTYWNVLILVDLGALLLVLVLTVVGARRQPVAFTLYLAGLIYVCLAAPNVILPDALSSVGRVLLVAIPAFLLVSRWTRRWPALDLFLVSAGFMLQAALATYFLSGGWVE
jgi:hypothetical protein